MQVGAGVVQAARATVPGAMPSVVAICALGQTRDVTQRDQLALRGGSERTVSHNATSTSGSGVARPQATARARAPAPPLRAAGSARR